MSKNNVVGNDETGWMDVKELTNLKDYSELNRNAGDRNYLEGRRMWHMYLLYKTQEELQDKTESQFLKKSVTTVQSDYPLSKCSNYNETLHIFI